MVKTTMNTYSFTLAIAGGKIERVDIVAPSEDSAIASLKTLKDGEPPYTILTLSKHTSTYTMVEDDM